MMRKRLLLIILTCCSWSYSEGGNLQSCFRKRVSTDEYLKQYQLQLTNYTRFDKAGSLHMELQYIPNEIQLIRLLEQNTELAKSYKKESSKNSELIFQLKLSIPAQGLQEFLLFQDSKLNLEKRIEYYHFDFQKDIQIQWDLGEKSIPTYLHFDRLFNLSPYGLFTMGVTVPKKAKSLKIIVKDNIYDHQTSVFEFDVKLFQKLPRLKAISKLIKQSKK